MVKRDVVSKKVNAIRYHLERIQAFGKISLEEFLKDKDAKDIVCHNLFIVLQNIIDICSHIISDGNMEEPAYVSQMAEILSREKVIRKELERPLKNMMGFRNIIAHQYGDLDFNTVHVIVQNDLPDIYAFLEDIIEYAKL